MLPDKPIQKIDVSRRQLLVSSGSFIAGASALAWAGTDRAAASTDIRDINIPPTSVETPDGGIESAGCTVVGDYQYNVNDADTTRLELLVAPPDGEFQAIDTVESAVNTTSGSGQYTLNGSILDHDNITKDLFAVEPEKIKTVTFPVRVRLAVLFDGEAVVEALAEGLAEVEVESGEIVASAAVLGEGEVAVEV